MNSTQYILGFSEIDRHGLDRVGGKGANLGELSRISGIQVPHGFCVTTEAYGQTVQQLPEFQSLLAQLAELKASDRTEAATIAAQLRGMIERAPIADDIAAAVTRCITQLGVHEAYAVRSSATAEDLPNASFAGQQDTYLNVIGVQSVLQHIRKCWASLFTDRAVSYRIQHGFDHRKVQLSVVVQQMIFPEAAGILFTADPVSSSRKVISIDAGYGLGEALVSGIVSADNYKVRNGKITGMNISSKTIAVYALPGGGTTEQTVEAERRDQQVLTDEQILQMERIGRTIEKHFGSPQDIEWCLADDTFYIVQSRPITTLFPVPDAGDQEDHVYVSVGHQQMMTDAMKPLGLSFFLLTTRAPMRTAGGRLFVDITAMLRSPGNRQTVIDTMGKADPLIKDALLTVLEHSDFLPPLSSEEKQDGKRNVPLSPAGYRTQAESDPAIVTALIEKTQASLDELKQRIQTKSGTALFDYLLEDLQQLKHFLFDPGSFVVIMAAMDAAAWINEKMEEWLGEKNAADTLAQSVPHNVTSEMGLALLDVADVIRPYPEVTAYLQQASHADFLRDLPTLNGGSEALHAINDFLNRYGMRCAGEIDITRARWSEEPATLVPVLLSHIKKYQPGESKRRFEQGLHEALKKEKELMARVKQLPDGEQKAEETKRMIDLVRAFSGVREYPKYGMVCRYFEYKKALLKEAELLVQAKVIHETEDVYYLSFEEFREAVRTQHADQQVITQRREEFRRFEKLTPTRVLTSDGEAVTGRYKREDLPPGAIAGLAVSAGVIEGRARVIVNMQDAGLEEGDILVTVFTDPSWTPLFVSVKGLVTEVGGLMTHGAVIAREYGLPAVVGVENATRVIRDGQRIRVNGTEGYVEILE
jgi:pyruvate,water dikinase